MLAIVTVFVQNDRHRTGASEAVLSAFFYLYKNTDIGIWVLRTRTSIFPLRPAASKGIKG